MLSSCVEKRKEYYTELKSFTRDLSVQMKGEQAL